MIKVRHVVKRNFQSNPSLSLPLPSPTPNSCALLASEGCRRRLLCQPGAMATRSQRYKLYQLQIDSSDDIDVVRRLLEFITAKFQSATFPKSLPAPPCILFSRNHFHLLYFQLICKQKSNKQSLVLIPPINNVNCLFGRQIMEIILRYFTSLSAKIKFQAKCKS